MSAIPAHLPIFLVGLPGAGKTRVARLLSERLGVPCEDTDEIVVRTQGRPVTDIFRDEGEAAFREYERRAIELVLNHRSVISLGGGAVTSPQVRQLLKGQTVVFIDADHDELVRRTSGKNHRPLLAGDADAALRRLRSERAGYYDEVATIRVTSDSGPVERVVEGIMMTFSDVTTLTVDGPAPYDVLIGHALVPQVLTHYVPAGSRTLIVHPPAVAEYVNQIADNLTRQGVEVAVMEHPDGESGKTFAVAEAGWQAAAEAHIGRRDTVIGIGGGATTDLAGFIAATWLRGVDVIQIPTTLLGMVDAAVGGKTGINTPAGKNLVGSFHTPRVVIEDVALLDTLPSQQMRSAMGEVIKCGFIADRAIIDLIRDHIEDTAVLIDPHGLYLRELVERSVAVKVRVVSSDLKESGMREILNYGHTLAHAIERQENFTWRHGDAVAVGCIFAAELAHARGMLTDEDVQLHRDLFSAFDLPVSYSGARLDDLVQIMKLDKKVRNGELRVVLLDGSGHPVVQVVDPEQLRIPASKVGIHAD